MLVNDLFRAILQDPCPRRKIELHWKERNQFEFLPECQHEIQREMSSSCCGNCCLF